MCIGSHLRSTLAGPKPTLDQTKPRGPGACHPPHSVLRQGEDAMKTLLIAFAAVAALIVTSVAADAA